MKPHYQTVIHAVILCLLSLVFTGCDNGSSNHSSDDVLPVVSLEYGVLIPTASDVRRFDVNGNIAYVVTADGVLQVMDVSDSHYPKLIDSFTVDPEADIAFGDGMLYVLEKNILRVFDAGDPHAIKHQQDIELQKKPDSPYPVSYLSSLACHNGRIFSVLMTITYRGMPYTYFYAMDAAYPEEVQSYLMDMPTNADQIAGADGDWIYAPYYANISRMDTGDLANIQFETMRLNAIEPLELAVAGQTACFINQTGANDYPLALAVADVSGATDDSIDPLGILPFTGKTDRGVTVYPKSLAIQNDMVYVALLSGELMVFDIRIPQRPKQLTTIDYGIVDPIGVPEIRFRDMEITQDTAFIGCSQGLVILDLAGSSNVAPLFTLNVKAGDHCSVTIDPQQDFYEEGQAVNLTLVPETGWKFKNWLGDASPYENPVMITMNSDRTVIAISETIVPSSFQVPVVLRITESGAGTVMANPPGGTYHADPHGYLSRNLVVALTAKPEPGWRFDHWEGDVSGTINPETIVIDGYKNVTAVYNPVPSSQHTLQVEHTGMGGVRIEPAGGVYNKGAQVTVTAIPDNGWTFSGWSGDLPGDDASRTLIMDLNYLMTAEFTEILGERFTLTARTDRGTVVNFWPPTELSHDGETVSAEYKPGTEVTITAVTRPGYTFIEWGGDLTGPENPQALVMDSDKTISLISEAE